MLLEQVWDFNFDPRTTVVETQYEPAAGQGWTKPFEVPLIQHHPATPAIPSMRRASVFSGIAFRSALLFLLVFAVILGIAGVAILKTTQASDERAACARRSPRISTCCAMPTSTAAKPSW